MLLPLAVAAVSCGKEPVDTAASLSVQPTLLEFAATGNGSQSVAVTATNTEWTHEVSGAAQEWLSASLGEDGKSLLISVTDNPTAEKRSGTVSVKAVDHIEIKPIGITVQQEAGEGVQPGGSITVSPESLTFAGEGAEAQRVAVTVSNPELTWTAAPEDAAKEWITVTADGDGISVSVSDNPETDQRSGNIIITPGLDDVRPRAVRVVQEGKILPLSLDADPKEVPVFAYDGSVERIITVTAVNCDWAVRVDYTEGDAGGWVKAQTIKTEAHSALSISVGRNETLEARSASVTVYALGVENIPDIVIPVSQEAGKEFFSTLTGPVAISDMESLGALQYHISPSQTWDTTNPGTYWIMDMWSSGVSQESDLFGNQSFLGSGTRIYLKLFSENIPFNDDQEFTLPAGEYRVKQYDAIINKADIVPYTVEAGRETKDLTYPSGSWYMKVDDGGFAEAGPLTGGSMTVAVDGPDTYTFTFDFVDDRGNAITGTAKGTVTKASCNFFPEEPGEDVEPDPDPDPDPVAGPSAGRPETDSLATCSRRAVSVFPEALFRPAVSGRKKYRLQVAINIRNVYIYQTVCTDNTQPLTKFYYEKILIFCSIRCHVPRCM